MGKAAQCIEMLQYLNSGKVYSRTELAALLETNPRNIIEYRKELEEAGYIIGNVLGRYGGYYLDKSVTVPAILLGKEEKEALSAAEGYFSAKTDFPHLKEFLSAMAKINSSVSYSGSVPDFKFYEHFPLAMPREELEARYDAIRQCTPPAGKSTGRVMEITYISLKGEVTVRKFHPYKLFMNNSAWFALGYDEKSADFRYFKLNRILQFRVTGESFRVRVTFNEHEYLDEFGMKKNGDWYAVKLKITGGYAVYVRDRVYGRNQTIEPMGEDAVVLSFEMQNKEDVLSFVLGFGTHCEVLEPAWLAEERKDVCRKILGEGEP